MAESALTALREHIAGIERGREQKSCLRASLGHEAIDARLGGGLARGRLHELFAQDAADAGSAAGFAAMLAARLGGLVAWLRVDQAEATGGRLHGPGLGEIGIDPARLLLVLLPDPATLLRAAVEVVRCPEIGVAVIELWRQPRPLDLTASRRLSVAADASGVTALMLRADAEPSPSTADTRWAVRAAASAPLEANAPGHPAIEVELLRQRGGPADATWRLEWVRDRSVFRDLASAAPSGAVVPPVVRRPAGAGPPQRRAG